MSTVTGTPYGQTETGAAYTQAAALLNDEFDTSGTPSDFCPDCEHAPCVAGGVPGFCARRPRFFVRRRLRIELIDLVYEVSLGYDVTRDALVLAIYAIGDMSWTDGWVGDEAWKELLHIHSKLRSAKENS